MISAPTYNLKGEPVEKTNLPEALFGVKVAPQVLAQAVRVYLSNQRQSPAKTKTRSEVAKTTAKMYKQKGTGRARHGSYAAPIFVGGGISHGPSGEQNYTLKMSDKLKRLAFLGSLSQKATEKVVFVISGAEKSSGKTKDAAALVGKIGKDNEKLLIVVTDEQKQMKLAWRNLENVTVCTYTRLNPYIVLNSNKLVITSEAIEGAKKRYVA